MIVVTGTKRSGTSMWMQILVAAGFPVLGEAFPPRIARLREANPAGFYESRLAGGVYYKTNPDPERGHYLHPEATRGHVVKVFIPGLVRSDVAFLHHVVGTLRPWRQYVASMARLQDIERGQRPPDAPTPEAVSPTRRAVEWWGEVYALVRDASTRRYPLTLLTYDRLLRDPEGVIAGVLEVLGEGDLGPAVEAVRPELRNFHAEAEADPVDVDPEDVDPEDLDPEDLAVFDAVYEGVDQRMELDPALLEAMNRTHRRIRARWGPEASAPTAT